MNLDMFPVKIHSLCLLRDQALRIFPAMFVEGLTDLAFQDVPPEDPDFGAIQGTLYFSPVDCTAVYSLACVRNFTQFPPPPSGLAECGLIASQLSQSDLKCRVKAVPGCMGTEGVVRFSPDRSLFLWANKWNFGDLNPKLHFLVPSLFSPLTRQDMLSWRVALEHRVMPPAPQVVPTTTEKAIIAIIQNVHSLSSPFFSPPPEGGSTAPAGIPGCGGDPPCCQVSNFSGPQPGTREHRGHGIWYNRISLQRTLSPPQTPNFPLSSPPFPPRIHPKI